MPKAKNRIERSVQVFRWLESEFDFPNKLSLRWISDTRDDEYPDGLMGYTTKEGRRNVIYLCHRNCRGHGQAIETLIHEAAHAYLWNQGLGYLHGPVFWQAFGEMMDAYDHHGRTESRAFSVD